MIGLGETFEEIEQTLADLAAHNVKMVTIGQIPSTITGSPTRPHIS